MAEGPALEKRYPAKSGIVGSNPTLSAITGVFLGEGRRFASPMIFGGGRYRRVAVVALCGEMSELAEGARLEIVCVVYSGTEGSNPSLSATILFHDSRLFLHPLVSSDPFACLRTDRAPRGSGLPVGKAWDTVMQPTSMQGACVERSTGGLRF